MADPIPPCAKCGHERIYVVNPFQVRNYEYSNSTNPLPVATGPSSEHDVGSFEMRVCAACGYTEMYARDLKKVAAAAVSMFSNVKLVTATAAYR